MRKIWRNEEGVSPVIAVILMVAITVVLAAVLYVMVSGMITQTETTPHASMTVEDTETSGKYLLLWQGSVKGDKIDIGIYDASLDSTYVEDQPDATTGTPPKLQMQVPGGCYLNWTDNNDDDKLDGADTLVIYGAASGDRVTVTYRPTGETVASATI